MLENIHAIVDQLPNTVKIVFVLAVTFGFFAVGCYKAHKERHIKTPTIKDIEA